MWAEIFQSTMHREQNQGNELYLASDANFVLTKEKNSRTLVFATLFKAAESLLSVAFPFVSLIFSLLSPCISFSVSHSDANLQEFAPGVLFAHRAVCSTIAKSKVVHLKQKRDPII